MRRVTAVLLSAWVLGACGATGWGEDNLPPVLRAQVALDGLLISPGVIDGVYGPSTVQAVTLFQKLRGLPVTGKLDDDTLTLLTPQARGRLVKYRVTAADLADLGKVPEDWVARSRMKALPHQTLLERLAERSHVTQNLLCDLNPGVVWLDVKAGDEVQLLDFPPVPAGKAEKLDLSLGEKAIRVVGPGNRLLAYFRCSIAEEPGNRPQGTLQVTTIVHDPPYTFDPALWPESGVDRKLTIPPGPNNPVGAVWIGLSKPGFGLHGTPEPEKVSYTGSHGCFRLTNWDVERLAAMVQAGTPVVIRP